MESIQQKALNLRKQGKYREAIAQFSKAIAIAHGFSTIELLDARAACYEQLKLYDEALVDAKTMMMQDREDARVYQLLDRDESALACYQRGQQNVRSEDKLRKLYLSVEARLRELRNGLDPFSLPTDVVLEILTYLSFAQKMRCRRVCRRWNEHLDLLPGTYADIDFIQDRLKLAKPKEILRCLRRAKGKVKSFRSETTLTDDIVRGLMSEMSLRIAELFCSTVVFSTLRRKSHLKHLYLHAVGAEQNFENINFLSILQHLGDLQSLKLRGFTANLHKMQPGHYEVQPSEKLRVLNLGTAAGCISGYLLPYLFEACPRLCELSLPTIDGWPATQITFPKDLRKLHLGRIVSMETVKVFALGMPPCLRDLRLDCHFISTKCSQMVALENLQLVYPQRLSEEDLSQLILANLQQLELIDHELWRPMLESILSAAGSLSSLTIIPQYAATSVLDDQLLCSIASKHVELRSINLARCNSFSGAALAKAVDMLPLLKVIDITDCAQVDVEIQNWMRNKGIRVLIKTKL